MRVSCVYIFWGKFYDINWNGLCNGEQKNLL